jgi:alkanesulfonate monooxygenase SsuD/methylene tetrahydromethanopterin reductase-like flavin-dependent oxidoreductase (luciferase family)
MKFGVMINHQYLADEDLGHRIEEGVESAELVRDSGYDLLFSHHHFLANMQTPQALPILAHLVPFTGRMRLGIGVYIATLEHPVALAEHFATLDQISGGRLVWGVGAGYREDEFNAFGIDLNSRQSRLYESLELVRQLWSGEDGSPNVKFKWANGNLAAFRAEQERLGIDTAGREYPIVRELYIADTDEQARREVHPYMWNEYSAFSTYDSIYSEYYEEMWDKAFLIGSPDTVADKLTTLADGGWNTFIFRTDWAGMPVEMMRTTITRFAQEVMPRFAAVSV